MANAPRSYTTIANLKTRLNQSTLTATQTARYLAKIRAATAMIERYTARCFEPVIASHKLDWTSDYFIDFNGDDCLSVTSIVDGLSRTVASNAIVPLGSQNTTIGPFYGAEIDPSLGEFLALYVLRERSITVTGVWGYHDEYADAWHDTGVTLNGSLNSSATTITTTTNTGTDVWGYTPALSEGQLIAIDSEWLRVVSIASSTSILVARGQNGSTAASHNTATAINTYLPQQDIVEICTRFAALMANMDDTTFGQTIISAMGTTIPAGMPADVCEALAPFRKRRVS